MGPLGLFGKIVMGNIFIIMNIKIYLKKLLFLMITIQKTFLLKHRNNFDNCLIAKDYLNHKQN